MTKSQVIRVVDQVMKVALAGGLVLAAVLITIAVTGCKPAGQDSPRPLRTAVVHVPTPLPSWADGMELGCFVVGVPVAPECLEGGAPTCPYDSTTVGPCWATAPDGRIWYRP